MSNERGQRLRALRKRLDLSQQQVADRTDGVVGQGNYAKMETGKNLLNGFEARQALARALGMPLDVFSAYLDGAVSLEAALGSRAATTEPRVVRDPAPVIDTSKGTSPLNRALGSAFDNKRHDVDDIIAVKHALDESFRLESTDTDLVADAREWLDVARQLRREGREVTAASLMIRAALGRSSRAAVIDEEIGERNDLEAKRVAEAAGRAFGDGEAAAESLRAKKPTGTK